MSPAAQRYLDLLGEFVRVSDAHAVPDSLYLDLDAAWLALSESERTEVAERLPAVGSVDGPTEG